MTTIYVDTSASALVVSPQTTQRCLPPILTAGDTLQITLAFLQRNPQPLNTGKPIYLYQDFSASAVKFLLGNGGMPPAAGSFTRTWAGSTTPALPFNCSSYDVAAALNALSSITMNGGVTVSGDIGGPFTVQFLAPAVRQAFTSAAAALYPASGISVLVNTPGTTTTESRQTLFLSQYAAVSVTAWAPQPAAAITVSSLQANIIQRVTIPNGTYSGAFTLTINALTTPAIPFGPILDQYPFGYFHGHRDFRPK